MKTKIINILTILILIFTFTGCEKQGGSYDSYYEKERNDLDCSDYSASGFSTPSGDPNGLDRDGDGVACE